MADCHSVLNSSVRFLTRGEGQDQISTSDAYTQNLSKFDLQAKIRTVGQADERLYFENARRHVRAWTKDEVVYLGQMIAAADKRARELGLRLQLPKDILLIKTTGWEEGHANGYTRENAIYLNQNSLSYELLLHELFHVISRSNPSLATQAYGLLKFQPCADVAYTDDLRISNPDAPFLRHFTTLHRNGGVFDAVIVMRASRPYAGGGFFAYVRKKLLVVEGDGPRKSVKIVNGAPILVEFSEVDDLYAGIGRNTGYNIHQEEVTAVHFELIMRGKAAPANPQLTDRLRAILSGTPA